MNIVENSLGNESRDLAALLTLGVLCLALVLTVADAFLIFVFARLVPVPDPQTAWTPVFPPMLIVAIALLVSIWAVGRRHLLIATGLTVVSAALAAIMAFLVAFGVGMTTSESRAIVPWNWVNIISSIAAACFILCVLSVIACVAALVGQRSQATL